MLHRTKERLALVTRAEWLAIALFAAVLAGIVVAIGLLKPPMFDDYHVVYQAARTILRGESPYDFFYGFTAYMNAPWVALLIVPFALAPFSWSSGLLTAASLVCAILLCRHFKLSLPRTFFVLLSPVMVYLLVHGQNDLWILMSLFLPVAWWPLAVLAKPQINFGIAFEALRREHFVKAALITAVVLGLSFLVFGNWIAHLMSDEFIVTGPYNLWLTVWPKQVPVGVMLIVLGYARKDIRLLLAGSPFLFPYANVNSFIGLWIVMHTEMEDWHAAVVFVAAWLAAGLNMFVI